MYQCPNCHVRTFTYNKYLRHLQYFHESEPHFFVVCGHSGCQKRYKRVSSLRIHVFRTHKILREIEDSEKSQEAPGTLTTFNDLEETFDSEEPNINFSEKICEFRSLVERHFALFSLKLQEKHILPKTVRHTITHDVKTLIELFNEQCRDLLKFCLEETNINLENHSNLKSLVEDSLLGKCLDATVSDYQFEKYCIREFGLIEPVEYLLGYDSTGRKETFQYIPILEVLKNILKSHDVLHYVVKDIVFDGETLKDFTDGLIFQQHGFFDGSETQLRLQLYTDEFEVLNCLGSKKQIHKISCVYFVLGNIPMKYRSSLKNIHVAVLVRNRLLQKYGYEKILQPLLRDLCELQCHGISVDSEDQTSVFKGSVISICSDNLSAHSLAGFNTCFSQGRICRFCLCHHRDIGNKTEESECVLRTPDTHRRHLQVTDGKSLYGVTGHCPFDELPHFQVTESFPPDLMHDILEGVIPQVLKLVLRKLNCERLVTLEQFNDHLQQFPFGQNDITHRPVLLKPSALHQGVIPGKAVERLTLFRLLPFLIGSFVPHENTYWALYLLFRSICDIVLAPVIKTSWLSPLSTLITEFLKSFQRLFPDNFTPKIHFLVHYPRLIKQHGPLRAHWCLRYEAKHQYFKHVSSVTNNYQNIAKTLAKRYQMRQCWEAQSTGNHYSEDVPYSLIEIPLHALPSELREIIGENTDELSKTLWKTKQLVYDRVKYTTGDFLILDLVHAEEIPVFLKVIHIVKYNSQWKLCGRLYKTWCFSEHLHAYGVQSTTQWVAITPGEETDFHALDAYTDQGDNLYITLLHRPNVAQPITVQCLIEHEIDGATLAVISERMSERLFPIIRKQTLFLAQLEILKSPPIRREHPSESNNLPSQAQSDPHTSLMIPALLRMAIERRDSDLKSASKTKLRTLLIQTLFDQLSMKTMYPTHLQYIELLSTLITDYPFLRESIGSGYDSLLESLRNKFKKERKTLVANSEIQRIKERWAGRKRPLQTTDTNPRTTVDAGEDERSIKEHLRAMKVETEKLRPNIELLKEKLALIKCYQRNFVSNHSTEETLSEFPCFRLAKILLWIMRDHTSVDVDQQLLAQLSVMAPRVLEVSRSPLKERFSRKIEDCVDGRLKKGLLLEAAILLLPALFKEDPGLLFEVEGYTQTSPSEIPTPKMLLKGCREGHPMQYDHIVLVLDGHLITEESEDISMALGLLLCVYFAFGIQYPKGLKKTLIFLECVVLKLKDPAGLPVTVKRVYNSICE